MVYNNDEDNETSNDNDNIVILIDFIFDLIDDSEALQDYLLDGGGLLKRQILKNPKLSMYIYNINNLLRVKKLLKYIERNYNYLLSYEKLIGLNKVEYKRKEIILLVKNHIEEVKNNNNYNNNNNKKNNINNNIDNNNDNNNEFNLTYKMRIEKVILEIIELIKKHAILLERFKNNETKKTKYEENSFDTNKNGKNFSRRKTLKESLNKKTFSKKNRVNTMLGYNYSLIESSKLNSLRPFIKSEKNLNKDTNDITNINNENNNKNLNNYLPSMNPLKTINMDNNSNNTNNIKNVFSNDISESGRLLKDSIKETPINLEQIKAQFPKKEELSKKIETKKTKKISNKNLLSSLIGKSKNINIDKVKTTVNQPFDRKETLRSIHHPTETFQKYLNKLGKISVFVKFFINFNLDNVLFIEDNFLNDVFKGGLKLEEFENPLYIFFYGKFNNKNNLFLNSNNVLLYLFHLYNMLFPTINSNLKAKIKSNRNISGMDIIEEFQYDNDDNNYEEIDEKNYNQEMKNDFDILDKKLCILYSLYQFAINQYAKTVYRLATITSNYYLNFGFSKNLVKFKFYYSETIKHLLSVFAFMRNDIIEKIYSESIYSPSLLNQQFDLDNLYSTDESIFKKVNSRLRNKKKFNKRETILIEYIFYFLKKCDKIRYLYEKILIYKYIKNLVNKEEESLIDINNGNSDSKIEEQLQNFILPILFKKKEKILLAYETLLKTKAKYTLEHHHNSKKENKTDDIKNIEEGENDDYAAFKIEKRIEIITKLLRKYEIKYFLNNIIYMESNKSFFSSDKLIKKIRKLREHLYQIKEEIKNIRINLGKDINLNETENINLFVEKPNQDSFERLNRFISLICNESGKLFNMNKIEYNRKDKLGQLISMENKFFYQKLKFYDTFEYMIHALSYYRGENNEKEENQEKGKKEEKEEMGEKDQNILIYCSFLLKIFNDMENIDFNFHKNIVQYRDLYSTLLKETLKNISEYPKDKIEEKEEYLFLNICFFAIEDFLLILKNTKLQFSEIKDFMENIFSELQNIFKQFKNRKNKIIFQILYTYAVSRVLLIINKKKAYDSYSYDVFFKNIFPQKKMKENISFCVETINNNSNKENLVGRETTNIFYNKETDSIDHGKETFSIDIQDDEKDPLIFRNLKSNVMSMDLSNVNKDSEESRKSQENIIIQKEEKINNNIKNEEFIMWEDENEVNRLSFYLNFLSVYVIYLNDKNTLSLINKKELLKREKYDTEQQFSFRGLKDKIKYLLDYRYKYNDFDILNINNDDSNNLISSHQNDISLIIEEKKYLGEDLGYKNLDYKFHSTLLESILNYRANFGRNNIEIQVKKAKKRKEELINEIPKLETQNELMELNNIINDDNDNDNENKNDKPNIIFYYYSPQYIDIILLEKIFNGIELKEDLMSYCVEEYNYGRETPKLLEKLLFNKKQYKTIETYYEEEYDLIHNYFIRNEMKALISQIINSFNSKDLIEIQEMDNYLFKKMGEIYSDSLNILNEDSSKKSNSLVEFLALNEDKIRPDWNKMDLLTFFDSLVYIYPKYEKSICIIYYKIGFELLSDKCKVQLIQNDAELNLESNKKIDLELITNNLILLFSRNSNKELIEDKIVFSTMMNSIKDFFSYLKEKNRGFIFKKVKLLKELFHKFDFIFNHLSKDFEKIVTFMKKPNNIIDINKYLKKRNRLKLLLDFLINFFDFQKKTEENILTEEINIFTGEVLEKVIQLLFILLELPSRANIEIINILIDFLFNFIKGPDINNVNLLFSKGFFDLVSFVIKEINYYQLFLNFLNKDNMHEVIDGVTIIECKIIKIFIIYYNLSHSNNKNSIIEFKKLQSWYELNFEDIKKKLKRLYFMSDKEMKERSYDINRMLLFIKKKDDYNDNELRTREGIHISNKDLDNVDELENFEKKKEKKDDEEDTSKNSDFCIIKFDLLLAYYSLYNYHTDLATQGRDNSLTLKEKKNKNMFYWIIIFFYDLFYFLFNLCIYIILCAYYIFRLISSMIKKEIKKKKDVDLLQDIKNIEIKSQLIEDKKVINFLTAYIRELEVTIQNNIFKIYFPMIDKANTLEKYKEEYYKVEEIDSSDFINYILSNYDSINIKAKQYVKINKILKIPILSIISKNIYIFAILLIILGVLSNMLIMASFSTFIDDDCGKINFPNSKNEPRIQCPHFLYKENENQKKPNHDYVLLALKIFGFTELVLQCLIFLDYIIRIFAVEKSLINFKYRIKILKKGDSKNNKYTFNIYVKTLFKSIINFGSLYYILSILFIILGLKIHPFFNCATLLEFVNRIQLMQTILKALYKPLKDILITLLMFIILEYLFSLFAVTVFTSHFPNITDTKNFLKTFMRMMDQTFKQDGGIGTYLDKSLDKNYTPYTAPAYFNLRFFFDLLFFLLILLLIFQMFLSTIIDYFNDTRENTEKFKEGLETKCIVCGMEREKIEKIYSNNKNAFDNHINYYHNAFNYIYYLMYLQSSSSSSKDSIIEKSIWDLHLKKDLSYLPKNTCFKQNEKKILENINQRKNEEAEKEN